MCIYSFAAIRRAADLADMAQFHRESASASTSNGSPFLAIAQEAMADALAAQAGNVRRAVISGAS